MTHEREVHGSDELDFSVMVGISMLCAAFLLFGQVSVWRSGGGAGGNAAQVLATVCYGLAVVVGGAVPLLKALPQLMRLVPNVDGLMVLTAAGAMALGHAREGGLLMLMFSLAHTLEAYALGRTRRSLDDLREHWNEDATRWRDGVEETVPIRDLRLGDQIIVRPGERIALDGVVLRGSSAVHEAAITGEPLPVDKAAGDTVYGGTLNDNGMLLIELTSTVGESTLARLIRLVEQAQEQESLTQRLVAWVTARYALVVLAGSFLLAVIPILYLRVPAGDAVYRGLKLLVVASPCALVAATPAALFSAITAAAYRGVLLKGGVHVEAAAAVRVVALDKTGTLTYGRPSLTAIVPADGWSEEQVLRLAAAVEQLSEHPLAKPVVALAGERRLDLPTTDDFRAQVGRGVEAMVAGQRVRVGSSRWLGELGLTTPAALAEAEAPLIGRGERALVVAVDEAVVGLLALADSVRPEAAAMVRDLRASGIQRVVMLTGDSWPAAQWLAELVGLDEVHAELLPADKLAVIEQLRAAHGRVVMVGDGINDAPALARADVGVAMGGIGSDLAMESADVILVSDDLWRLPAFLDLARAATRQVVANLLVALLVIVVLVAMVFSQRRGWTMSLPEAVAWHEASTVFVVLNGLRLLRWQSRYDAKTIIA